MATEPPAQAKPPYGIAALVGGIALVALLVMPRLAPAQSGLVGQPAPDVALPVAANGDASGPLTLSSLRGHPVVLDFWASWCGPCAVQAPILERIAERYEKQGLVVVGVDVDDPADKARAYAKAKGLRYPIVLDPGEASKRYGVDKLPSLVVIDRDGRVSGYYTGVVDEAALDEAVAATL
jgi:thiol-disulfide isomerase/thioredoxin